MISLWCRDLAGELKSRLILACYSTLGFLGVDYSELFWHGKSLVYLKLAGECYVGGYIFIFNKWIS